MGTQMLKILTIVAAALALVIANTDRSLARGGGGRAGGRPGNGGFRDSGSRGEGEHGELRSEEGLRGEAGRNAIGDRNVGQTLSARNFQNAGHFTQKVSQSTMANRAQNVRNNFNRDYFNR